VQFAVGKTRKKLAMGSWQWAVGNGQLAKQEEVGNWQRVIWKYKRNRQQTFKKCTT
jgi:hypothetical protein